MRGCKGGSLKDSRNLAVQLAAAAKAGDVFLLYGDLGAGKTTFARFFIQSLCGPEVPVPSPTFTLVQTYETPKGELYHYDLYRLENPEEVYELGIEESLSQGICLIEWPEKLPSALVSQARRLRFHQQDHIWRIDL